MKTTFITKFTVLLLLVIAIATVFTGCFGSSAPQTVTITGVTRNDEDGLTQDQLDTLATVLRNNTLAWQDFIAAYRGYDILDADKNLKDYSETREVSVKGAQNVVNKYASDKNIPVDKLDKEDVVNIVEKLKTTVSFEENRDFIENIRFYLGVALKWVTNTVGFHNYLLGLCIFAILVEICMLPLSVKQQKNSIKQATLRPKEMAIRNHYKGRNDQATQQKVNSEIQQLYEKENFNPMGGCLPMLLQLPIVMLLYNIVIDPVRYVLGGTAEFGNAIKLFFTTSQAAGGLGMTLHSANGTIEVLSQIGKVDFSALKDFAFFTNSSEVYSNLSNLSKSIPDFNVGPINFGYTPSLDGNYWLLVVPVLTFVVYYFSMKISKKFTYQATQNEQAPGAGCSNKTMELMMPVMSTFFSFAVPGAIGIYWVFRSVLSTVKQFVMSKIMPVPHFTEEDYKAAEKELYSSRPQRKRKNTEDLDPNRERPRSLHHIDDDEEEYPTFVK